MSIAEVDPQTPSTVKRGPRTPRVEVESQTPNTVKRGTRTPKAEVATVTPKTARKGKEQPEEKMVTLPTIEEEKKGKKAKNEKQEVLTTTKAKEKAKTKTKTTPPTPPTPSPAPSTITPKRKQRAIEEEITSETVRKKQRNAQSEPTKKQPAEKGKTTAAAMATSEKKKRTTKQAATLLESQPTYSQPKQAQTQAAETEELTADSEKRTRRPIQHPGGVIAISCVSTATKEIVESAVQALGAFKSLPRKSPESAAFTHLIMQEHSRTMKLLFALARGAWVLGPEWIYRSLELGRWQSEEEFVLDFMEGIKLSRKASKGSRLLKGRNVHVGPTSVPDQATLSALVTAAHGKLVSAEACDLCISSEVVLGSAGPCVSTKWFFDSLEHYQLLDTKEYEW